MKKLTQQIREALAPDLLLVTIGQITEALKPILSSYSLPVILDEVEINDSVITLELEIPFEDEVSEFEVHFYVDSEGIPQALVFEEDDEDDYYTYSLEGIASKTVLGEADNEVVNLLEPAWLEESVLMDILSNDIETELEERFQFVIRGGKKVKKKLVRRLRRRPLTAKQKAGIRKAVAKRKSKKAQTARKRKISNKLRKRMKLGKNKNNSLKVAGTSSRK